LPFKLALNGLCIGPPYFAVQFSKINPALNSPRFHLFRIAAVIAILTQLAFNVKLFFSDPVFSSPQLQGEYRPA
jgi:hypothetical protein